MNSRRWVIILISMVVILIAGYQILWRVFSVEDYLRDLVVREVQSNFRGEISIERVSANLQSLNFHEVAFTFENGPKEIKIKKLALGFSIFNFLKYNFNPVRLISDIVVEEPVVKFQSNGNLAGETRITPSKFNIDSLETEYENQLIDLGFVGRVVIDDGSIIWINSDSSEIGLLSKLKGWVSTTELEHSTIRMNGRLFGSENENIQLTGLGNLNTGRIDSILINFFDDKLSTTIPTIFPEKLKIKSGELEGAGVLKHSENGKLELDGYFSIKNARLDLFEDKIKLQNLNATAFIRDWNVEIESCDLNYQESPVKVAGTISNLLDPVFDLIINSTELDLEHIVTNLLDKKSEYKLKGQADVDIKVTDFANNPTISGKLFAPLLFVKDQTLQEVQCDFVYHEQLIKFSSITGLYNNFKFQNSGELNFRSDTVKSDFQFKADGDIKQFVSKYLNPDIIALPSSITGSFSGRGKDIDGIADVDIVAFFSDEDSLPVSGKLKLKNSSLWLSLSQNNSPFSLDASINIKDDNLQIQSHVNHFGGELWALTPLPVRDQLKKMIDISIVYTGDERYATSTLIAHRKEYSGESDKLFQIDGFFSSNGKIKLQGDMIYFSDLGDQVHGEVKMEISSESVILEKYQLGNFFSGSGRVDFSGQREIYGKFNINNADLVYILDGIFLRPSFNTVGKLSGDLVLNGTLDKPEIYGNLILKDWIIRSSGYYTGNLDFRLAEKKLHVQNAGLILEEKKLLEIKGQIDLESQILDLDIKGKDVEIPIILGLISSDIDFITGKTNLDLKLRNQIKSPDLQGEIVATKGKLFFVNYDSLILEVGKSETVFADRNGSNGSTLAENEILGLHINSARLVRGKRFSLEGTGFLPYNESDDLDLFFQGKGDIFALLFEDEPFILGSRSESEFSWGIGGPYSNLIYTEGKVSVKNGMVQLEDLAPIVENIEGEAVLEPSSQFLRVDFMTGTVRDNRFSASTRIDSIQSPDQVEPLIISDWGLNFGIIEINTEQKGVPLHIPGLMEKDDEGWFVVQGREPADKFTISGPEQNPLARGKILTYDASFTFPFIVDEEAPIEVTLIEKILYSMIWEVDFIPVSDIHYVKKIPGIIDNVWINLNIDPQISHLNFSGKIADDTFRADGILQSTRGSIELLDLNFKVEKFAAEFDRNDIFPLVYGRARTTVSDSSGFPSNIYLTLTLRDSLSKLELERGRWNEDIRFKLTSDNPNIGTNELQILAALGYSFEDLNSAEVLGTIGTSTDHLIIRPLFRPVERKLERVLKLDVIRLKYHFARNVMDVLNPRSASSSNLLYYNSDPNYDIDPRYLLFRSTQVVLGKYLSNNLYLLYSGQIDAGRYQQYQQNGLGLRHSLDLEYRIYPNLLLELQYNYDSLLLQQKQDKRIQIRHSFNF